MNFVTAMAFSAGIACLAACVTAPDRSDPGAFNLHHRGKVPADQVPAFTDCVMDGFAKAHFLLTKISVRQQRRATGFRVDATVGDNPMSLASVDIFDDGRVELFERALFEMLGERAAFAACVDRFGK
jgi:hypothetical protein